MHQLVEILVEQAAENTDFRQHSSINLIPSEQNILSNSEGMSEYHIDVDIADDLNSLTGHLAWTWMR